ncbi:MAG: MASE1 domain-containing protein [Gaiellaceae bacterium]
MSTHARIAALEPALGSSTIPLVRVTRRVGGIVALAAAYYAAAKIGQALRYTGSVSAVWPPVGVGIGALYLFGLQWWPGIFLGELAVNFELLVGPSSLPGMSVGGQWAGNMAEVIVGAILLRRLLGPRAALDRTNEVVGLFVAVGTATAVSATVGTFSMRAGGVIGTSGMGSLWRTWWLGDTAGALVVLPLVLAWAHEPRASWRRLRTFEGAFMIAAVTGLAIVAVSAGAPLTYMVFPALIWAAFRFGSTGATLAVAIVALLTIGITADDLGLFSKQPIDERTLGTQLYLIVAALTALFVAAVVSERERAAHLLANAKQHEGDRALEERHRIARELHDSVSQALFSALLETRVAQKALDGDRPAPIERALGAVAELIRTAQTEMRALIFELGRNPVEGGLVPSLNDLARTVTERDGLPVHVYGPQRALPLSTREQVELFAIVREALANVVKHAGAGEAWVRVAVDDGRVSVHVADDGCGFSNSIEPLGHFGLASMRSRARGLGGVLTIDGGPGLGTLVHVTLAADSDGSDGR